MSKHYSHEEKDDQEKSTETTFFQKEEQNFSKEITSDIVRPEKESSLQDEELHRRTVSIFEEVKGCKIDITYESGNSYCYKENDYDTERFVINLATPNQPGNPAYSVLGHELGHILWDSCIGTTGKKYFREFGKKDFPNMKPEHENHANALYDMAANVLEDERTESKTGKIYLGTMRRFEEMRKQNGINLGDDIFDNPCNALLAARFGRYDIIKNKEWADICKSCIEDIRETDKNGLIVIGERFITKMLNPWLRKNGIEMPIIKGKRGKGKGGSGEGNPIDEAGEHAEKYNKKHGHDGLGSGYPDEDSMDYDEPTGKKSLEDCKKDGKEEVEKLKEDMDAKFREKKAEKIPEDCGQVTMYDRYDPDIQLTSNKVIARGLNKAFKEISSKAKLKLHESGEFLDMGALIRRKAKGFGDVFKTAKIKSDLTLLVSIDVSGSMSGAPCEAARRMCCTIFDSIKGVKGINFYCFAWNGGGSQISISEIAERKDCRSINVSGPGGTPTTSAMAYSIHRLLGMPGKKKCMIFITDGAPDGGEEGTKICRKWVAKARKAGITVIGMYPCGDEDGSDGYDYGMKEMFGAGNYMIFSDMDRASARVINKFKTLAIAQVKGK